MSQTGFRTSEIRRKMDVYSLDGVLLGSVTRIFPGNRSIDESGTNLSGTPDQREFDGESIGPAPTRSVGNPGPATQSPETFYATSAKTGEALGDGEIEIGTFMGMFLCRRIPLAEVQTVSLERIVLRQSASAYLQNR
jgi:hypothetical protein